MNMLQKKGRRLFKTFLGFSGIICVLSILCVLLYKIYVIITSYMTGSLTNMAINCILFFGALIVLYIFSDIIYKKED